ncbi:hypothetical protein MMPV_008651 [Pyropia vietnamensis]
MDNEMVADFSALENLIGMTVPESSTPTTYPPTGPWVSWKLASAPKTSALAYDGAGRILRAKEQAKAWKKAGNKGKSPPSAIHRYTLVDVKASNLAEARRVLAATAAESSAAAADAAPAASAAPVAGAATHTIAHTGDTAVAAAPLPPPLVLPSPGPGGRTATLVVHFVVGDAVAHAAAHPGAYHLVVASALLDLFADLQRVVGVLAAAAVGDGGVLYAPLNFDGVTALAPSTAGWGEGEDDGGRGGAGGGGGDGDKGGVGLLDDGVAEARFHAGMDVEGGVAQSRTGRRLAGVLRAMGSLTVTAVGGSSWVVLPAAEGGGYVADEAYFLHCILTMMGATLAGDGTGDGDEVDAWLAKRRQQVEAGALEYVAHNLDYCAVVRRQ